MRRLLCSLLASAMLLTVPALPAQDAAVSLAPASVVPHLIKYSGTLPGTPENASAVEVKFALYGEQTGGDPLWTESQQVAADSSGKYSVLLGSTTATGLPDTVFATGQARWLGVTLSGEQESPRAILVATPYSLKASDAETLGGHPASDFKLVAKDANGKPETVTDISQLTDSGGLTFTNGGTGPTVGIGLDETFLLDLGNEVYPQLSGTNNLTGKNTFAAGKIFIGTSPVLSAANVVAGSGITVTPSGNNVTLALNDTTIESLGNLVYPQLTANNVMSGTNTFSKPIIFASGQTYPGTITSISTSSPLSGSGTSGPVELSLDTSELEATLDSSYAQLGAANTFTAANTITGSANDILTVNTTGGTGVYSTASTYGVFGSGFYGLYGTASNYGVYGYSSAYGVWGESVVGNNSVGVTGTGDYGVYGSGDLSGGYAVEGDNFASSQGIGVIGTTIDPTGGVGVWGYADYESTTGTSYPGAAGVWGDAGALLKNGAVYGTTDDNYAGDFMSNGATLPTLRVVNHTTSSGSLAVFGGGLGGECDIYTDGDLACSGSITGMASLADGRTVSVYAPQATENWLEDYGSGKLANGEASITLDPEFADLVNTGVEYHVFLTPGGDSNGLYVTNKSAAGFEVREQHGGRTNISFDYKIVARRKGYEQVRMADQTARLRELHSAMESKSAAVRAHPMTIQQKRPEAPAQVPSPMHAPLRQSPPRAVAAK